MARKVVFLYGGGNIEMANGAIKQRQAHFNPWMCRAGFKDNFCGKHKHLTTKWKLKMGNCIYSSKNGIMMILVQLSWDQVSDMIHTLCIWMFQSKWNLSEGAILCITDTYPSIYWIHLVLYCISPVFRNTQKVVCCFTQHAENSMFYFTTQRE